MRTITIGNKDYKLEYSIEASLYAEATEAVAELFFNVGTMSNDETTVEDKLKSIANIPQIALTVFYAGLMENHGIDGDGTVTSKKDAKALIKKYIEENADDENANMYGVLSMCAEEMGKDNFFKQIGLEQMLIQPIVEEMKTQTETTTTHKKTTTRKKRTSNN